MTKYHHPDHQDYDCSKRSVRDWVRSRHDISDSDHDSMIYEYFKGSTPIVKELAFSDLNLGEESCHQWLIHVWYDPNQLNSSEDIHVELVEYPDNDEPAPPDDGCIHDYFSDMYFNASRLHFGMSTIQFTPAHNGAYRTIVMRFRGGLTWHHGNITSQIPLDKTGKYLP